jgi:hypothetical protein
MGLHVFVAMPFGKKPDSTGQPIDFDRIYADLIRPALKGAGSKYCAPKGNAMPATSASTASSAARWRTAPPTRRRWPSTARRWTT